MTLFGKIAVAVAAFAAVVFFVNRGDPKPDPEFRDVKYRDTPVDVSEFARFAPEMEPFTLTVGLRTQCVCRVHRDLVALLPGGAPRKLTVAKARELLATVRPGDEVGRLRRQLIADQIRVAARSLRGRSGHHRPGPERGDRRRPVPQPRRLRVLQRHRSNRPGSAGNPNPAVNLKGNRKLNHAVHVIAITQIRNMNTDGRALYERKLAEGKTKKEAVRVVKRRISDAIYRQLLLDAEKVGPGGQTGTTLQSSVTGSTPTAGSSDKPQPGPAIAPTTAPLRVPA